MQPPAAMYLLYVCLLRCGRLKVSNAGPSSLHVVSIAVPPIILEDADRRSNLPGIR